MSWRPDKDGNKVVKECFTSARELRAICEQRRKGESCYILRGSLELPFNIKQVCYAFRQTDTNILR